MKCAKCGAALRRADYGVPGHCRRCWGLELAEHGRRPMAGGPPRPVQVGIAAARSEGHWGALGLACLLTYGL